MPAIVLLFQQTLWRDVEKQLARQAKAAEAADRTFATEHFQLGQNAVVAGGGKQGKRGVQRAVGWAAAEGLKANDALFQRGDNGLEEGGDGGPIQDGDQGLTLFGYGHSKSRHVSLAVPGRPECYWRARFHES